SPSYPLTCGNGAICRVESPPCQLHAEHARSGQNALHTGALIPLAARLPRLVRRRPRAATPGTRGTDARRPRTRGIRALATTRGRWGTSRCWSCESLQVEQAEVVAGLFDVRHGVEA